MDSVLLLTLVASALRATTPLLLAGLGGMFSERSGIVNIALEGIILFGALAAAVVPQMIEAPILAENSQAVLPWLPWIGLLAAMVVGGLIAAVHAVVSIRYKADQIISGTAINLMAIGVPAIVLQGIYQNSTTSEHVRNRLPLWEVGPFALSPLVYIALILVPLCWWLLFRTPFGLRLRSVGEHPEAADSVGIKVIRLRYIAVIASGLLAGLAGAYLSIGTTGNFVGGMSGGRGFIALAALIFGKWHPLGVLGSTLLFGAFQAAANALGGGTLLPPTVVQAMPYVLTLLVLAGFIGKSAAPKALGSQFDK